MTWKMHLKAKVPNEGARRLAWCLGNGGVATVGRLASVGDCDVDRIERLLAGEIIPGAVMAAKISAATYGSGATAHWRQPAVAGWFDDPTTFEMRGHPSAHGAGAGGYAPSADASAPMQSENL